MVCKVINYPEKDKKLTEFIGILLGDGYICSYVKKPKVTTYMLKIAGNSEKDFIYMKEYVSPLIEELFHIKVKFCMSKTAKCIYILVHGKKIIEFLYEMGLKPQKFIVNIL